MNKTFVITLGLLLSFAAAVKAQKFGYCNSNALLADIPEIKAADSELKAFQSQLTKRGQERVKALQTAAGELDAKKEKGLISPVEYDAQSAKLQKEQEDIAKYEQEVYDKLAKKREELFKPLLDKVNNAMNAVAKENGYMFVFDTGDNTLLYADESLDVTNLVKAKLAATH